jgi:hypothetical protein
VAVRRKDLGWLAWWKVRRRSGSLPVDMGLTTDTALAAFPELEKLVRPAVRIESRRVRLEELTVGASRFGGSPDLPEDFEWPENRHGEPLAFLAQLDLRKAAGRSPLPELPNDGWLLIFYDLNKGPSGHASEFNGWRVLHVDGASRLARRAPPREAGDSLSACSLRFHQQSALPSLTTLLADESGSKQLRSFLDRSGEEYGASRERLMQSASGHRLLGYPDEVQGPMHQGFASALVQTRPRQGVNPFTKEKIVFPGRTLAGVPKDVLALVRARGPWRLLLQLDTDEAGPGWMWGDAGRLYFWIRERDLTAGEFSRVWIAVQGG